MYSKHASTVSAVNNAGPFVIVVLFIRSLHSRTSSCDGPILVFRNTYQLRPSKETFITLTVLIVQLCVYPSVSIPMVMSL